VKRSSFDVQNHPQHRGEWPLTAQAAAVKYRFLRRRDRHSTMAIIERSHASLRHQEMSNE